MRQKQIYNKMVDKECTFTPNLENTKKWNDTHSEKNKLFEKLSCSSSRERSQLMLANSQTLTNDLYDPETGQELFQPKVGRGPRDRPAGNSTTAGDQLYQTSQKESIKRKNRVVESQIASAQLANRVFTNQSTNKIIDRLKEQAFKQIFVWLDSDRDGLVSAMKIDISKIDTPMLEAMGPLFVELEECGQPLDEEEFTDAL